MLNLHAGAGFGGPDDNQDAVIVLGGRLGGSGVTRQAAAQRGGQPTGADQDRRLLRQRGVQRGGGDRGQVVVARGIADRHLTAAVGLPRQPGRASWPDRMTDSGTERTGSGPSAAAIESGAGTGSMAQAAVCAGDPVDEQCAVGHDPVDVR